MSLLVRRRDGTGDPNRLEVVVLEPVGVPSLFSDEEVKDLEERTFVSYNLDLP